MSIKARQRSLRNVARERTEPSRFGAPVSAVERIAAAIAYAIASGRYAAGARLPPVRQLAQDFGINPNTVQVALGRLQASGFVSAHPRLGLVVRDIEQFGGIPTWRYIFQFAQRLPDRALRIAADLLELRLLLITEALEKIAANPTDYKIVQVRQAVELLELKIAASPQDPLEIARAELHAVRQLMLAVGQTVVTAVLNSIGEIYLEVPAMIEAMYVRPADHVVLWREVLNRWERGAWTRNDVERLHKILRQNDVLVVERFRATPRRTQDFSASRARAATARARSAKV